MEKTENQDLVVLIFWPKSPLQKVAHRLDLLHYHFQDVSNAQLDHKDLLVLQESMDPTENLATLVDVDLPVILDPRERKGLLEMKENKEMLDVKDLKGHPDKLELSTMRDNRDILELPEKGVALESLESLESRELMEKKDALDIQARPVNPETEVAMDILEFLEEMGQLDPTQDIASAHPEAIRNKPLNFHAIVQNWRSNFLIL